MTISSAPGKIILFGEHTVVYGRPALAVPVTQVHTDVEISDSARAGIWIDAPAVNLHAELNALSSDHLIASVINNFFFLLRVSPFPNLEIKISSTIPVASGLGSGAAVTVALTRALASHLGHRMTDEEVNAFTNEIEKLQPGTPTGIANTVVTYAKPVYFVIGQPIETFEVGVPFTIIIADSGIPAPTNESAANVRKLWESDKKSWEKVFAEIGDIAFAARHVIKEGWIKMLGALMDENHSLLKEMTVSSPELDSLVVTARSAGALGAKLSGGRRGGNMIALVDSEKAETVSSALKEAGAKNIIITQVS